MTERQIAPYGAWESPIGAELLAGSVRRLMWPAFVGDELWWVEGRPDQGGRETVMRLPAGGAPEEVLPQPWSARSRVHEYGGRPWVAVSTDAGPALVFAAWSDQRLYRLDAAGGEPRPLTPEPAEPAGLRYADLVTGPDDTEVWAVRERHDGGTISRHVVAVPVDGSAADDPSHVREIVGGSHFVSNPRPSPDGRRIAWLAWEHPDMPWDATELRVADLDEKGAASSWRVLLGGPLGRDATDPGDDRESVFQPEWAGPDALYAVADRTGWWNLYRIPLDGGEPTPLCPREEEFGQPQWVLGLASYAVLADGRIAAMHSGPSGSGLGLLDPATGVLTDLDLPYTDWEPDLATDGRELTNVAASPYAPATVVRVDPAAGTATEVRAGTDTDALPDGAYLPDIEEVTLTGPGGRDVHANVYLPKNPRFTAPDGDRPPLVVFVHGGPTSQSGATLSLTKAYFTSRGIGVVDVNYGGSTGYGRAYRERLRGQWGIVDVEDCVAAARALADQGRADPARLAIRGGSAGGWTVLAALTSTDAFACGASYFGVAELLKFAETTHDFESRYLDGLIGKLPDDRDTYVERAPLSHVDDVSCPVLLLQGLEDAVVPPAQAEMFREALARKEIPHAYLPFEGEQHGFRKAETIVAATEAELSFYGQVMGFDPPGVPRLALEGGVA